MLVNSLSYYCPQVWDTQEELGVCFSVHFQIGYPQDTPQVCRGLLHSSSTSSARRSICQGAMLS
jgi:hypothetical protein